MAPMGTGDGSGGRSYGCAASAANGAANNGASDGTLRKGLPERNRYRKTKQEQQDQVSFHVAFPPSFNAFLQRCFIEPAPRRSSDRP